MVGAKGRRSIPTARFNGAAARGGGMGQRSTRRRHTGSCFNGAAARGGGMAPYRAPRLRTSWCFNGAAARGGGMARSVPATEPLMYMLQRGRRSWRRNGGTLGVLSPRGGGRFNGAAARGG